MDKVKTIGVAITKHRDVPDGAWPSLRARAYHEVMKHFLDFLDGIKPGDHERYFLGGFRWRQGTPYLGVDEHILEADIYYING